MLFSCSTSFGGRRNRSSASLSASQSSSSSNTTSASTATVSMGFLVLFVLLLTAVTSADCSSTTTNKSDSVLIAAAAAPSSTSAIHQPQHVHEPASFHLTTATARAAAPTTLSPAFLNRIPTAVARFFGSTLAESMGESEVSMSRTFGRIQKKLTVAMLPVMFKLGIMTMVIFAILLLAAKAVFIGKLLLIINLGFILAKLIAWKSTELGQQHHHHHRQDWAPSQRYDSPAASSPNDIHLHIHNAPPVVYPAPASQNDLPYGAYAPRGASITIDTAPPPPVQQQQQPITYANSDNALGSSWGGGYQRRNSYANGGFGTGDNTGGAYGTAYAPQSPVYIPNAQY